MGRRARAKRARLQQEAAFQRRQDKIAGGWKPPTQEEMDERIANKQCDAQDRVAAAEKRRKDRQRRKEVEAKERVGILSRLGSIFSKEAREKRADDRIKVAEERRKKKVARLKSQQERREKRARQREEASRLGQ